MTAFERVPLASLTTFKVGGPAEIVIRCANENDVQTALSLSRERCLPWYVLGGGSNVVASDRGYAGVILLMKIPDFVFEPAIGERDDGKVVIIAGAGIVWDMFVRICTHRGLWGVENLAGIPGTVGASPVQNIGAYGAEVSDTLIWVEALDVDQNIVRRFAKEECGFGYRESRFKHDANLIILRVAFELSIHGVPHTGYADLTKRIEEGASLTTPLTIAEEVRDIRARKFPDLMTSGTAGSFFKNPVITNAAYEELKERYPDLPGFPQASSIKVSLAWILDHVLHMRGFALGLVRLFENQPLVLVSEQGATAYDIDMLAREIERMVLDSTNIVLEREVRFL